MTDVDARRLHPRRRATVAAVMAIALALAGLTSASANTVEAKPARAAAPGLLDLPTPEDIRDWLAYDRPTQYESVLSKVRVPTRDGTRLACDLYRPGRDGEVDGAEHPSLLLEFTPYTHIDNNPMATYLTGRGYNVLICYVRGSGDSKGSFPSWFQPKEATDTYDLIEWLARRPGATGDVGQVGTSYGSMTAYRGAAQRLPHLRAILPIVSSTNLYSEWAYPGGVPTINGAKWANSGPVLSPEDHTSMLKSVREHPLYDAYWKQVVPPTSCGTSRFRPCTSAATSTSSRKAASTPSPKDPARPGC
ncbi:hypothetical protein GCM10023080_079950 [Streptomyces pseudoechinosporeus]